MSTKGIMQCSRTLASCKPEVKCLYRTTAYLQSTTILDDYSDAEDTNPRRDWYLLSC